MEETQWWQIVAAVSAAVGALAAAAGAGAAWRSARASERMSRESRRALAAALRPRLKTDLDDLTQTDLFPGRSGVAVVVHNISDWDAADVDVEALYRDGERIRETVERLRPHDEDPFAMSLRPEDPERHLYEDLARITVRFSDAQRIARYELRQDFFFDPTTPQGASSFTARYEERVEQIAGP